MVWESYFEYHQPSGLRSEQSPCHHCHNASDTSWQMFLCLAVHASGTCRREERRHKIKVNAYIMKLLWYIISVCKYHELRLDNKRQNYTIFDFIDTTTRKYGLLSYQHNFAKNCHLHRLICQSQINKRCLKDVWWWEIFMSHIVSSTIAPQSLDDACLGNLVLFVKRSYLRDPNILNSLSVLRVGSSLKWGRQEFMPVFFTHLYCS